MFALKPIYSYYVFVITFKLYTYKLLDPQANNKKKQKCKTESFLQHHIPPINIDNLNFLVGDSSKSVRIIGPEYLHNFFGELQFPFYLFTHCIKYYDLTAV